MATTNTIADLTVDELRDAVAERYGHVATHPDGSFNFPVGRDFAEAIGYSPDLLNQLPAAASQSFAGIAYLPAWIETEPDMTLVDLGCGAGLDSLIMARQFGTYGQVIAVDYSHDMVALARKNAQAANLSNVRVLHAPVEQLPFGDASVDVAIANGIFNLSPEHARVAQEVARILKPGGNMTAAEIVLTEDLSASERTSLDDWFR